MRAITLSAPTSSAQRWLRTARAGRAISAFALTEPDHGSDSVALASRARRDGDEYVLDGDKHWIGNGHDCRCRGRVGARRHRRRRSRGSWSSAGTPGYEADPHRRQGRGPRRLAGRHHAGRAFASQSRTACRVRQVWTQVEDSDRDARRVCMGLARPRDRRLRHRARLRRAARAVRSPLGGFQLVQDRLVRMLADLSAMQLVLPAAGTPGEAGRDARTPEIAGLAKLNNTRRARWADRAARDLCAASVCCSPTT